MSLNFDEEESEVRSPEKFNEDDNDRNTECSDFEADKDDDLVNNPSPKVSTQSPSTVQWTCIKDVLDLSSEFEDVNIVCKDETVQSNKLILSSLFPFFEEIFSCLANHEEDTIILFPQVEADELRDLLKKFYKMNSETRTTRTNMFQNNSMSIKDENSDIFDIEELDPLKDEVIDQEDDLFKNQRKERTQVRKVYHCPQCSFTTHEKKRIPIHIQYRHSNNSGECPLCGELTVNMEKHHEMHHLVATCKICEKICSNKKSLLRHIHNHNAKNLIPDGKEKCTKCLELVNIELIHAQLAFLVKNVGKYIITKTV